MVMMVALALKKGKEKQHGNKNSEVHDGKKEVWVGIE